MHSIFYLRIYLPLLKNLTIEADKSLSWLPNYFLEMSGVKFVKQ